MHYKQPEYNMKSKRKLQIWINLKLQNKQNLIKKVVEIVVIYFNKMRMKNQIQNLMNKDF